MVKELLQAELIGTDCEECLKKRRATASSERFICSVLKQFYFLEDNPKDHCWASEFDSVNWVRTLSQIKDYNLSRDENSGRVTAFNIDKEISKFKTEGGKLNPTQLHGLGKAYREDLHRGKGGGGGEKADKTNKLFGRDRMKDNRPVYPYKDFWKQK